MISVASIQTFLGVTGDDAYLAHLEQGAVDDIQTHSGLFFGAPESRGVVLTPVQRFARLTAPEVPKVPCVRLPDLLPSIASVTSVEQRYTPSGAWESVGLTTSESRARFELHGTALLRLEGFWPVGLNTVRVTYSRGYAEDAAPANVNALALDLIRHRYEDAETRKVSRRVSRVSIRGASIALGGSADTVAGTSLPADLRERIEALRPGGYAA